MEWTIKSAAGNEYELAFVDPAEMEVIIKRDGKEVARVREETGFGGTIWVWNASEKVQYSAHYMTTAVEVAIRGIEGNEE